MYKLERDKQKVVNYLYDHPIQKNTLEIIKVTIITLVSSFVFALGFNSFTNPNFSAIGGADTVAIHQLASCGASGLSQSLLIILKLFNIEWLANENNANIVYWMLYFAVNIPLLILAWCKIGKRFCIFTALNVASASFFGMILKSSDPNFFVNQLSALFVAQPLARALFAGVLTGVSSGLAYVIETSAGGADILSYYISERKSILVGKYSLMINVCIVALFSLLSIIPENEMYHSSSVTPAISFAIFLYTLVYMFTTTFMVDKINTSNAKVEVKIITTQKTLPNSLIAALPHSCTILNGYGGYSLEGKYIVLISVRKAEVSKIKQICKKEDPKSFVDIIPLDSVYGKFYRKRIK
jgi:uncharacterized membrane-anchored protein YitT (DUF2179 family)